jgi:YggT family protein
LTSLLANFVTTLVWALNLAILGRVVLSWISPSGNDPVTPILYQITEPILAPIRRFMPQFGMLDLTPMVALLLLNVIIRPLILRLLL